MKLSNGKKGKTFPLSLPRAVVLRILAAFPRSVTTIASSSSDRTTRSGGARFEPRKSPRVAGEITRKKQFRFAFSLSCPSAASKRKQLAPPPPRTFALPAPESPRSRRPRPPPAPPRGGAGPARGIRLVIERAERRDWAKGKKPFLHFDFPRRADGDGKKEREEREREKSRTLSPSFPTPQLRRFRSAFDASASLRSARLHCVGEGCRVAPNAR